MGLLWFSCRLLLLWLLWFGFGTAVRRLSRHSGAAVKYVGQAIRVLVGRTACLPNSGDGWAQVSRIGDSVCVLIRRATVGRYANDRRARIRQVDDSIAVSVGRWAAISGGSSHCRTAVARVRDTVAVTIRRGDRAVVVVAQVATDV